MVILVQLVLQSQFIHLGKENSRLNGAWHDEGRIADCLAEDDLWNTLGNTTRIYHI